MNRNVFAILGGFCDAGSQGRVAKTPRESLLDAYDCCLAHPTPSHTPSGASLDFEGVACEEL